MPEPELRPRKTSDKEEYAFCHNDLSQANIIVGPETLKIKAIVDWEYAGFWPEWVQDAHLGESWAECGPGAVWGEGGCACITLVS